MAFKIENENDTNWNQRIVNTLKKNFPDREVSVRNSQGIWQTSRHIKVSSCISNRAVHYEYSNGEIYFHVEDKKLQNNVLKYIRTNKIIKNKSEELDWGAINNVTNGNCRLKGLSINTEEELIVAFRAIAEIFDPLLEAALKKNNGFCRDAEYIFPEGFSFKSLTDILSSEPVKCINKNLYEVFQSNLVVPDYQRDYCWGDNEIKTLISSLADVRDKEPYHLGTIILHEKNKEYNIIDGQQRLTTLTLFLRELGYKDSMPLLKQKFLSRQSIAQIGYAKFIIQGLVQKMNVDLSDYALLLANNITFSILILQEDNLDLAYTFFSNQNSKGVILSDYDLLKAHHLRYISVDAQAEHLATNWNNLASEEDQTNSLNTLKQTLGIHLYRLRHWLRKQSPDESKERHVKNEYVAAPIMRSIPPFGEKFIYSDKIQGGSHFFFYASDFVNKFRDFVETNQVSLLRQNLGVRSHDRYADVIETLLLAYYLKFSKQYLSEALFCISSVIADHRYSNDSAKTGTIRSYACDSEVLLMIEQASSPTFFLAEAMNTVRYSGLDLEEADIKYDFYNRLRRMFIDLPDITDTDIKQSITDEYQI